jgi:3-oxoacyl-[acyl-carrier protein] reductase
MAEWLDFRIFIAIVMLLINKTAVITGCAKGIGKSMLELFAQHGASLWACCRKPTYEFETHIDVLTKTHGVNITPVYFDLSDPEQVRAAAKTILSSKSRVDILVNNAGVTFNALFQMTTLEKLKEIFEVNFFSQMLFTQHLLKIMVRQKSGSIVNIASSAALDGNPGRSAYGASKAALICVTKALAAELADSNIRANAIAPGITKTDMVAASMTEEVIQKTIETTAMKRIGLPMEIAGAALFLASDLSSYITGQVFRVDGGM